MKVNEQLLTSYSIDLDSMHNILVGLSLDEVNSHYEELQDISDSLHSCLILLAEQLTSAHRMQEAGWGYEDTLGLVDTPSTESNS